MASPSSRGQFEARLVLIAWATLLLECVCLANGQRAQKLLVLLDGGVASAMYKNGTYKFKKQQERDHHTIKPEP